LAAILPTTGAWLAAGAIPLTDDVAVMARMRNRLRRLVVDGEPVVTGLVPVGDAAVCTNPLYGRGTSLALAHGFALADVISGEHDPDALSVAADALTAVELEPWYHASVAQDRLRPDDPAAGLQAAFFSAVRSDADVWRAFMRTFNLLAPPDAMLTDPVVQAKVLEAAAAGDLGPVLVEGAPSRDETLAIINTPAAL
jgi:2-polyprenyl-6-methoxyphenol hydroxylase-like FAD-dependent oxidoreductase